MKVKGKPGKNILIIQKTPYLCAEYRVENLFFQHI